MNACSATNRAACCCRLGLTQAFPTTSTWVPSWRSTCSSGVSATVAAKLLLLPAGASKCSLCQHAFNHRLEAVEPVCVLAATEFRLLLLQIAACVVLCLCASLSERPCCSSVCVCHLMQLYARVSQRWWLPNLHGAPACPAGGQCPVQKYWKELLQLIKSGELHPEIVITHEPTLDKAPAAYEVFNKKLDGCIKVKSLFCCWKQLLPHTKYFLPCNPPAVLYAIPVHAGGHAPHWGPLSLKSLSCYTC